MIEEVFVFPMSYAQQRLWFLDQLEPGNPAYNIFDTEVFDEAVEIPALEKCLNEIVRRHEALRTTFVTVDGQPMQVVAPTLSLPLPVLDLSQMSECEQESEVERLSTEVSERPFDLARGPLLRATLLRLSECEYLLLLTMHHIICDGWSMGVFTNELWSLYEAFSAGEPSPLEELPIQYADFAVWQRQWLTGEVLEQQLGYWREQLEGAPAVLELPTDKVRPSVQSFRGASQWLSISPAVTASLKALSQQEGVTLFMTLLAAFQTLLYRYTGQEDIVVGSPIANRTRAEVEPLIGFFVNTLVLRTKMNGNPSFRELLGRVREVTLGAYAHQDLPFEKLVEELQPERNLSRNPLVQVMFQLFNVPLSDERNDDLDSEELILDSEEIVPDESEEEEVEIGTAKFDLGMDMWESDEGLAGQLEYSTDLFEDATIRRMIGHFQTLLEAIAADPRQRISELPLLSEVERQQLLVQLNSTRRPKAHHRYIHEAFESQVERTPDAVAVISVEAELSYRELNRRANHLAHYLRRLGVGPEAMVAICMERSVEMLVGLLGILKAGGAYVPLDPVSPKQRSEFMLKDTGVKVLLTQERLRAELPEYEAQVISIDGEWEEIERESGENIESGVNEKNLAYIIYTSGSTGSPKGVMIQHSSIVNYIEMAKAEYKLMPKDRLLQFSSISFDAAAEEIYTCLTLGATLVLRPDMMLSSVPVFLQKCDDFKITVLDIPTSYWHELTRNFASQNQQLPESIRMVIIGGERALPERLSAWHKNVPGHVQLMHGYGPTEVTVVATTDNLSTPEKVGHNFKEVPIGRPIGNAQAFILDKNLQPVPIGIPGELHISGEGLARGYLTRPEATAEKFIPNPFSEAPGARLYKTGDKVRYLPDGRIVFLGRIDHQVKIRGFRIELGEVETVLSRYPAVQKAVVATRQNGYDDKRLVAYLVADSASASFLNDLRHFLREQLPEYMVPSAYVLLDSLPMTPSGKVNRDALPEPDNNHHAIETTYVAPRNEIERTITSVWREIFNIEKLSTHSNFFDLGGHSLSIVRVCSRLREVMNIEISMIDMFRYPTINSLANFLSQKESELPSRQQIDDRIEKQREALMRRKKMNWRADAHA